jgi:type IV pilus assembly protein PilV
MEKMMSEKDHCKSEIMGNQGGFTLLEVIMAISILTVGLLAVASMQISAMRGNEMSMIYSESTERVQDRVEKIMTQDFSSLKDTDSDGLTGLDHTGDNADDKDESDETYKVYWNIADNTPVHGVKTIRVIVQWQRRGKTSNYSFDMLRNRI